MNSNLHNCVDFHIHSKSSDGTDSSRKIINIASRYHLKAISITDHDTFEGSNNAIKLEIPNGLNFLPGIELSVSPPSGFSIPGGIHILGYGINLKNPKLCKELKILKKNRINRAFTIVERLKKLKIKIPKINSIINSSKHIIGRPHIAQFMVTNGHAVSINEAFKRYLGYGKPAYVSKQRIKAEKALTLINNSGGIAILAHPYLIGIKDKKTFNKFILKLKIIGLGGIEAIYPEHPKIILDIYCKFACMHKLVITGGTDFHGKNTPNLKLGSGHGNFYVPAILYKHLSAYLHKKR